MTVLLAAQVNGGRGVYAGPIDLQSVAKLCIASNVLWILIVNITKASILIQYLRIFSSRCIRIACYAFLTLLVPAACWAIFGGVFLCTPIAKIWNPELPGHCISPERYWLSVSGTDIALDLLILLLPLPSITTLHLPRKQKRGLVVVFTLGFLVCVISVVRMLTVLLSAHGGNYTASAIWAVVWSAVEANVGIICASLLSLKPLVVKYFPAVAVETQVPKHSMRIALIPDEEGRRKPPKRIFWNDEKPSQGSAGSRTAVSTPPSSTRSASTNVTPMSGRIGGPQPLAFGSPQPLAEMHGIRVVEPERCALMLHRPGTMSLFDMLKEDGGEGEEMDEGREWAQRRFSKKASSFVEHV